MTALEIAKRLREFCAKCGPCDDCRGFESEAADALESLHAENERLRELENRALEYLYSLKPGTGREIREDSVYVCMRGVVSGVVEIEPDEDVIRRVFVVDSSSDALDCEGWFKRGQIKMGGKSYRIIRASDAVEGVILTVVPLP